MEEIMNNFYSSFSLTLYSILLIQHTQLTISFQTHKKPKYTHLANTKAKKGEMKTEIFAGLISVFVQTISRDNETDMQAYDDMHNSASFSWNFFRFMIAFMLISNAVEELRRFAFTISRFLMKNVAKKTFEKFPHRFKVIVKSEWNFILENYSSARQMKKSQ
jgi:hypothetical protein